MNWQITGARISTDGTGVIVDVAVTSGASDPLQVAPFTTQVVAPLTAAKAEVAALCNAQIQSILNAQQAKKASTAANATGVAALISALAGVSGQV